MRISLQKLGGLCDERNTSLSELLVQAQVSRNAFYSLARKDSVLPNSIRAIAARLNVKPSDFMEDEDLLVARSNLLMRRVNKIAEKHPGIDKDNIRHMFLLLEEKPVERLRRALIRAQKPDIRR
jgi:hypothetical protein